MNPAAPVPGAYRGSRYAEIQALIALALAALNKTKRAA